MKFPKFCSAISRLHFVLSGVVHYAVNSIINAQLFMHPQNKYANILAVRPKIAVAVPNVAIVVLYQLYKKLAIPCPPSYVYNWSVVRMYSYTMPNRYVCSIEHNTEVACMGK